MLTSLGVVFGSEEAGFAGAGYLAVMVGALTASSMWKKDKEGSCEMCSKLLKFVWSGPRMLNGILEAGRTGMQPALFMLIGAAVDISSISESELGSSLGILAIALSLRICITYFCVGGDFEFWERLFVAVAWFPKATVRSVFITHVTYTNNLQHRYKLQWEAKSWIQRWQRTKVAMHVACWNRTVVSFLQLLYSRSY